MSGCGVTMSSARRPPQTGSPDIGSSGPKVGFGSKVNGSPEPDSTAIRSVLSTGVPAPGECEVDQQHQGRGLGRPRHGHRVEPPGASNGRARNRKFADSLLEGDGFELSVPRQKDSVFEAPQLDSAIPAEA